ncbi:MAG: EAL domain-containing protein [Ruminococcus sp.]|nr:EAL domain-containing protein [Ruminococcus sp.]
MRWYNYSSVIRNIVNSLIGTKRDGEQLKINEDKAWNRIFGSVWEPLTQKNSHVGAFMVRHSTKEVFFDCNAWHLMGFKQIPGYDEIIEILKRADDFSVQGVPVILYILDDDDSDITAGFVSIEEADSTAVSQLLSLRTQTQLIQKMTQYEAPGVLMLVKLDGTGRGVERDMCICSAVNAMQGALPKSAQLSAHTAEEIWVYVPDFSGDALKLAEDLRQVVEKCSIVDEFGAEVSSRHFMSATIGISCTSNLPAQRMHSASFALYEAISKGVGTECFSPELYEARKNDYNDVRKFSLLIDKNLFLYHFQPIVSARSGEIEAYEALMRTDSTIGLNPLEILDLAERYGRLYDIELATISNTISKLSENQSFFENRKLFINAISSQLLSDEDFAVIKDTYGELMGKVVIEFTEQTEVSDQRLDRIKHRLGNENMQLAIDDYGTGYSNTSNLLRYNPDYVKIDRSLIAGIDSNHKTQKIVSGIIDFLHASGYIALAEGVETREEMETVISMGVDLLQGFYISRPKPVLVNEIADNIKAQIVRKNLEVSGSVQKIYHAQTGENINLEQLALEKYTDVFFTDGEYTVEGNREQALRITLTIKDKAECKIVLRNILIDSNDTLSAIKLGVASRVELSCEGVNEIKHCGIFVPRDAFLKLSGAGSLTITPEYNDCFAIGNESGRSFGNIILSMNGKLNITASGEKCVAIGGGKNGSIKITSGDIKLSCFGGNCLGVGSVSDDTLIDIRDCKLSIDISSANAVGIGSYNGKANVSMCDIEYNCTCSGNRLCAIGTLDGKDAQIDIEHAQINVSMRGKNILCVGTSGGTTNCHTDNTKLNLYAEGGTVTGVGDKTGDGTVSLIDTDLIITFLTGNGFGAGSPNGQLTYVRGSQDIKINE